MIVVKRIATMEIVVANGIYNMDVWTP